MKSFEFVKSIGNQRFLPAWFAFSFLHLPSLNVDCGHDNHNTEAQIEVHNFRPTDFPLIKAMFEAADEANMRVFHKERNGWGCRGDRCVEYAFVSNDFLRMVNGYYICGDGHGGMQRQPVNVGSSSLMHHQKQQDQLPMPAAAATPTTSQNQGRSLHPKWKLWHEMDNQQQDAAMRDIAKYIQKYGHLIGRHHFKVQIPPVKLACELWIPGDGAHRLCGSTPPSKSSTTPCTFLSFGIDENPSYDIQVAEEWGCRGFATDAKVIHPSKLHPLVTFHNVGFSNTNTLRRQQQSSTIQATPRKLEQGEQDAAATDEEEDGWVSTIPSVRKFLKLDNQGIDLVKVDCQDGCEIALTRDVLMEDIHFFHSISQIDIETHVSKAWIESREELYYFGLLFPLLEEAGHVMVSSMVYGCSLKHEKLGCRQELNDWGFPCGLGPNRKASKSCHDLLFVKKEKALKPAWLNSH